MRKNNKITAMIMAGALAVSNLGALAIPMTAFAAAVAWTGAGTVVIGVDETVTWTISAPANGVTALESTFDEGDVEIDVPASISDIVKFNVGSTSFEDGTASAPAALSATFTIDGAKAARYTAGDTESITVKYDSNSDGDFADAEDYDGAITVTFADDIAARNSMAVGFYEVKNGKNVQVTSTEISVAATAGQMPLSLGALVGGGVIPLTDSVTLLPASPTYADNAYVEYIVADETVMVLDAANTTTNSTERTPEFTIKKPGTTKVTANYYFYATGGTTPFKSTAECTVTVKAAPTSVALNQKKDNGTTAAVGAAATATLSATEPSITYIAELASTSTLIPETDVFWVSEDEDIVKVSASEGATVTVTAVGNSPAVGTVVHAIAKDNAAYKTYAEAPTKAGALTTLLTDPGLVEATITVTSTGFDTKLIISKESISVLAGDESTEVELSTNNGKLILAATPSISNIAMSVKSANEEIATAEVNQTTGVVTVKGVKAGTTTIAVEGTYKTTSATGTIVDSKLTGTINVSVIDPKEAAAAITAAEEKAAAAEAAQKTAEDAATKAKADAAAQKTAAETATKEATAAKEAATKAAAAQKAAEDAAAAAEKKAADAAAAATGIKKGTTKAVKGQTFKATSSKAVTLTKIKNAKTVTVGSVVEINNQVYKVTALGKGALKAGKATKLTVDAQFLTKKGINADCAKGTGKIKTLIIKNQTKKAAPAKALVKAVKKYNKKVKVQYK